MGRKKAKLYQTIPIEVNPNRIRFTVKVSGIKVRDKAHLDAQQRFPATVVESKKHKPPKYKQQIYDYDGDE